jgi:hypothetical protein
MLPPTGTVLTVVKEIVNGVVVVADCDAITYPFASTPTERGLERLKLVPSIMFCTVYVVFPMHPSSVALVKQTVSPGKRCPVVISGFPEASMDTVEVPAVPVFAPARNEKRGFPRVADALVSVAAFIFWGNRITKEASKTSTLKILNSLLFVFFINTECLY